MLYYHWLRYVFTWPHDFILVGQSWACNEIWNNTQACSCFQQLLFKNTLMQELKTLIMTLIGSFIPHYHGRNIWDKNSWSLSSFNSEASVQLIFRVKCHPKDLLSKDRIYQLMKSRHAQCQTAQWEKLSIFGTFVIFLSKH